MFGCIIVYIIFIVIQDELRDKKINSQMSLRFIFAQVFPQTEYTTLNLILPCWAMANVSVNVFILGDITMSLGSYVTHYNN